jgi:hypothetical protein
MEANLDEDAAHASVPLLEHTLPLWNGMKNGLVGVHVTNGTHLVIRFDGTFDHGAWKDSIDALRSRHTVLAARIVDGSNGPEFVPGDCADNPCTVVDISRVDDNRITAKDVASDLVWQPFDSRQLFRAFVVIVSETEYVIGLVIHHFIADLWSMEIIGREVLLSYAAFTSGRRPHHGEHALQYFDYLADMRAWLRGSGARSHAEFWRREMANTPDTRLPVDYDCGPIISRGLCECARMVGATPFLVLLAAKMITLYGFTECRDVVISTLVSGRYDPRWSNVVGLFTNIIRVRALVDPSATFRDFVRNVRSKFIAAYSHQRYPDSMLRAEFEARGIPDISPGFNFKERDGREPRGQEWFGRFRPFELVPPPLGTCTPRYLPSHFLTIEQADDAMHCHLGYLSVLYKKETFVSFVRRFSRLLQDVSQAPASKLRTLLQ